MAADDISEIRIGIATGDIVAGSIGPAGARNYTVVGDTVNLAARLEAANKRLGTRILVDPPTRLLADDAILFREIGKVAIPGKSEPERVFELLGLRATCSEPLRKLAERYESGLAAYAANDPAGARVRFEAALELVPNDGPSRAMLARLDHVVDDVSTAELLDP